ncbi:NYN domain-containing protein [Marinomonas spartinae]|uniref:NYN domain-containing protein n=1 Tax=Marinomonas spartinae TaxID=1792290 RepID=UPI0018F1CBBD|nr:NYN domain-containing protein [Marinomonas spartinae]MBJ7555899.1 NYN domain-containing protein [Marinomonas spartinae]
MKRVTILVDVQNIYYTTRQVYGANFDYNAFWKQVTADKTVVKAIAYATDRGDEKQRQFQNILRAIGFDIKLKPYIQRIDGSAKGDWDVGITIDAMEFGPISDQLILASGDGDFDLLARWLREKHGTQVDVFGVEALTAHSLIQAATHFHPINKGLLLK